MDPNTAAGSYGFSSYSPAYPGGSAVLPMTDIAQEIPNAVSKGLGIGHQNPLFWLLIIFLIISGYLVLGFDFKLKDIGDLKFNLH